MELGNYCFGNSRGDFPIQRNSFYNGQIVSLFEAIWGENYSYHGDNFENDTFFVFPYYWGECSCGFEEKECPEKHINCYQNELKERLGELSGMSKQGEKILKELCKKYHLTYPHGSMVHCTCDQENRYNEWMKSIGFPEGHRDECLLLRPNFFYKPDGLAIQWYKYPLRDAYSSKPLSITYFRKVINDCIKSLKQEAK